MVKIVGVRVKISNNDEFAETLCVDSQILILFVFDEELAQVNTQGNKATLELLRFAESNSPLLLLDSLLARKQITDAYYVIKGLNLTLTLASALEKF